MRAKLPWQFVRVDGPSMTPTLRPGDVVLVRHGRRVRPGHVVTARFRSQPDLVVVKRVARIEADGWWLASDNPRAATDSAVLGVADVDAVAVCLFRGGTTWSRRLTGLVPRRLGPDPGGL